MKTSTVPAVVLVLLASPAATAETWKVSEGADGQTRGVWTVSASDGALNGAAAMKTAAGAPLKYDVAGALRDGRYTVQRVSPSDGLACVYIGKQNAPGVIAGTAVCNGVSSSWTALVDK